MQSFLKLIKSVTSNNNNNSFENLSPIDIQLNQLNREVESQDQGTKVFVFRLAILIRYEMRFLREAIKNIVDWKIKQAATKLLSDAQTTLVELNTILHQQQNITEINQFNGAKESKAIAASKEIRKVQRENLAKTLRKYHADFYQVIGEEGMQEVFNDMQKVIFNVIRYFDETVAGGSSGTMRKAINLSADLQVSDGKLYPAGLLEAGLQNVSQYGFDIKEFNKIAKKVTNAIYQKHGLTFANLERDEKDQDEDNNIETLKAKVRQRSNTAVATHRRNNNNNSYIQSTNRYSMMEEQQRKNNVKEESQEDRKETTSLNSVTNFSTVNSTILPTISTSETSSYSEQNAANSYSTEVNDSNNNSQQYTPEGLPLTQETGNHPGDGNGNNYFYRISAHPKNQRM